MLIISTKEQTGAPPPPTWLPACAATIPRSLISWPQASSNQCAPQHAPPASSVEELKKEIAKSMASAKKERS
jgi:hypothetical protein